jgi:pyruvate/2-oxoacid:ferredoxin oxidoreductase beta subunit
VRAAAVGDVLLERGIGENRKIELYGRYKWTCGSHAEALAFIKGVEAVLSHLID